MMNCPCNTTFTTLLYLSKFPPLGQNITGFSPLNAFVTAVQSIPTPIQGCTKDQIHSLLLTFGLISNVVSGCTAADLEQFHLWPMNNPNEVQTLDMCGTNTRSFITYNTTSKQWFWYNATNITIGIIPPDINIVDVSGNPVVGTGSAQLLGQNGDTFLVLLTTGGN